MDCEYLPDSDVSSSLSEYQPRRRPGRRPRVSISELVRRADVRREQNRLAAERARQRRVAEIQKLTETISVLEKQLESKDQEVEHLQQLLNGKRRQSHRPVRIQRMQSYVDEQPPVEHLEPCTSAELHLVNRSFFENQEDYGADGNGSWTTESKRCSSVLSLEMSLDCLPNADEHAIIDHMYNALSNV